MNRKVLFRTLFILLIVLLCAVAVYSAYRLIRPRLKDDAPTDVESRTITHEGVDYYPKQDMTVILLEGIDETGPVKESESYNNHGEADMIALIVFDETAKTFDVLTLNRDTIVTMPVLGIGGREAGTATAQLALSHTYGSGLKDSLYNTKKAVSDLLYGLQIDYCVSLNMDAISILTDAIGGVQVNVTDDFSAVGSDIPQGEVTLNGAQALEFVQSRRGVGDQLNLSRMKRQSDFMEGFIRGVGDKVQESDSFVLQTYDAVSDYMVSDLPANAATLNTLLKRYSSYTFENLYTPQGENDTSGEFVEFHVDEDALLELSLQLFYSKKGS